MRVAQCIHCSRRALGSILLFAVVGTMLSVAAITGGLVLVVRLELCDVVAWHEAAAFGSLISAVDPVATLNVFRALGVDRLLYMCAATPFSLSLVFTRCVFRVAGWYSARASRTMPSLSSSRSAHILVFFRAAHRHEH